MCARGVKRRPKLLAKHAPAQTAPSPLSLSLPNLGHEHRRLGLGRDVRRQHVLERVLAHDVAVVLFLCLFLLFVRGRLCVHGRGNAVPSSASEARGLRGAAPLRRATAKQHHHQQNNTTTLHLLSTKKGVPLPSSSSARASASGPAVPIGSLSWLHTILTPNLPLHSLMKPIITFGLVLFGGVCFCFVFWWFLCVVCLVSWDARSAQHSIIITKTTPPPIAPRAGS